jgi:hypothetical protein
MPPITAQSSRRAWVPFEQNPCSAACIIATFGALPDLRLPRRPFFFLPRSASALPKSPVFVILIFYSCFVSICKIEFLPHLSFSDPQ